MGSSEPRSQSVDRPKGVHPVDARIAPPKGHGEQPGKEPPTPPDQRPVREPKKEENNESARKGGMDALGVERANQDAAKGSPAERATSARAEQPHTERRSNASTSPTGDSSKEPNRSKDGEASRTKESPKKDKVDAGGAGVRETDRDAPGAERSVGARDQPSAAKKAPEPQSARAFEPGAGSRAAETPKRPAVDPPKPEPERGPKQAEQAAVKHRADEADQKSRDVQQRDGKVKEAVDSTRVKDDTQATNERQAKEREALEVKAREQQDSVRRLEMERSTKTPESPTDHGIPRSRHEAQEAALGHTATWAPIRSLEEDRLKGARGQPTNLDAPYGGAPVVAPELRREEELRRRIHAPSSDRDLPPEVRMVRAEAEARLQRRLAESPEFAKSVDDLVVELAREPIAMDRILSAVRRLDFSTPPSSVVLWSGLGTFNAATGEHEDSRLRAERFCARENAIGGHWRTLEHTPAGRAIEKADVWNDKRFNKVQRTAIWRAASERFVEQASGTVVVHEMAKAEPHPGYEGIPDSSFDGPILDLVEMPALLLNHRITNAVSDAPYLFEGWRAYQRGEIDDPRT